MLGEVSASFLQGGSTVQPVHRGQQRLGHVFWSTKLPQRQNGTRQSLGQQRLLLVVCVWSFFSRPCTGCRRPCSLSLPYHIFAPAVLYFPCKAGEGVGLGLQPRFKRSAVRPRICLKVPPKQAGRWLSLTPVAQCIQQTIFSGGGIAIGQQTRHFVGDLSYRQGR